MVVVLVSVSTKSDLGANITGNGTSDGVVPFAKIYDSTILATNQGSVRRGGLQLTLTLNMKILKSG